jgi:hypothetical protein
MPWSDYFAQAKSHLFQRFGVEMMDTWHKEKQVCMRSFYKELLDLNIASFHPFVASYLQLVVEKAKRVFTEVVTLVASSKMLGKPFSYAYPAWSDYPRYWGAGGDDWSSAMATSGQKVAQLLKDCILEMEPSSIDQLCSTVRPFDCLSASLSPDYSYYYKYLLFYCLNYLNGRF